MIYIAMPSYDGTGRIESPDSVVRVGFREPTAYFFRYRTSSLLADCFNTMWCEAINMNAEYFVMLHPDIWPSPGWVSDLMRIRAERNVDVVSAVVAIKDNQGISSTAIGNPTDPWRLVKRLTMREVHKLPQTFSAADCGYPECPLMVNTGCWICDLSRPWVRALDQNGMAKFCFNLHSRIRLLNGTLQSESCRSEDWEMSRHIWENGGTCLATREIETVHFGVHGFGNTSPWGDCDIDPLRDTAYQPGAT
jgi:hypothetical protein